MYLTNAIIKYDDNANAIAISPDVNIHFHFHKFSSFPIENIIYPPQIVIVTRPKLPITTRRRFVTCKIREFAIHTDPATPDSAIESDHGVIGLRSILKLVLVISSGESAALLTNTQKKEKVTTRIRAKKERYFIR